ncbi:MAG: HAD family hydrolase [Alphaproteobacteria bacterium]|nr:HAD family hydrolase [Alphaproteobacteria bacterium]
MIQKPHAVLFDWDNTLVDTWPTIGKAVNAAHRAMGMREWSDKEIRLNVARSLRDVFPIIYGDRWEEAKDVYYQTFSEVHIDMLKPLPKAEQVLKKYADTIPFIGVVSNKTGKYLRAEASHLGWGKYFKSLIGATDAPKDKPATDCVSVALQNSSMNISDKDNMQNLWFVGDSPVDIECAKNVGCVSVLVRKGKLDDDEFPVKPDIHVQTCEELIDLIQ